MTKTMLIYSSEWNGIPTFKLIPIDASCPFLEMIFMPNYQGLGVMSKHVKTMFKMIDKVDENGLPVYIKGTKTVKQERKQVPVEYEYFLVKSHEIIDLIERFAINSDVYDYKMFFTKAEIVEPISEAEVSN